MNDSRIAWLVWLPGWKWWVTGFYFVLILAFSTPAYTWLHDSFRSEDWRTVMRQVNAKTIYQPEASGHAERKHYAKKTFRLTVPMIARALRLNELGIYVLQTLLGLAFIYLMLDFCQREFGDRLTAFWFTLAATSVYFGVACFTDIHSYFSGWAFAFLFLAVYFRNLWLVGSMSLLAAWTDERGFVALAYVVLYWQYKRWGQSKLFWSGCKPTPETWAVLGAMALYGIGRIALVLQGYRMPGADFPFIFYHNLNIIQFGAWTFFEGLWLIVLYKYYVLFKDKRYDWLAANALVTGVTALSAFAVWDVTRSGGFMLLEVFFSMIVIYQSRGLPELRRYTFYAAVICALFPGYFVINSPGPVFDPLMQQRNAVMHLLKHTYAKIFL